MKARPGHRTPNGARFTARFRITLTATLLAAVTFLATGVVLLAAYRHNLNSERQDSLRYAAEAVLQVSDSPPVRRVVQPDASFQVLDARNRVIDGDPLSMRIPPIMVLKGDETTRGAVYVRSSFRPEYRVYAVAVRGNTRVGYRTAIVASGMDDVDKKTMLVLFYAIIAGLLFLPMVAGSSWLLVGRALRPVEQLRAQVAAITAGSDLSLRIPQAGGQDEISRLAGTLNDMLQALDEAVGTQQRFIADAAHELRTPLAGMTAYLEVAASHPDLIDTDSLVDRLLSANRHLGGLVNDLLTLAVLDAGAPLRHRPIDLAGVVQDAVRHVDPGDKTLEEDIGVPAMVAGNPTQLTRVVTNLVSNAVRHAGSTVVVRLRTTEKFAVLIVVDDGPGVPVADRQRIWQRFVRLDDDRDRAGGGSGLGLALVKEIVTAHAGAVWVGDAVPGPGAVFAFRLPLLGAGPRQPLAGPDQRLLGL